MKPPHSLCPILFLSLLLEGTHCELNEVVRYLAVLPLRGFKYLTLLRSVHARVGVGRT